MKIISEKINKILIKNIKNLDAITVIYEDLSPGHGKINIDCYGQAWTAYWPGMGARSISNFFCSCDEHYLAKKLSTVNSEIYDLDALQTDAKEKNTPCHRDDPWNDYEFLEAMYGPDMCEWHYQIPNKPNPDYIYLCRIIKTVQAALKQETNNAKK